MAHAHAQTNCAPAHLTRSISPSNQLNVTGFPTNQFTDDIAVLCRPQTLAQRWARIYTSVLASTTVGRATSLGTSPGCAFRQTLCAHPQPWAGSLKGCAPWALHSASVSTLEMSALAAQRDCSAPSRARRPSPRPARARALPALSLPQEAPHARTVDLDATITTALPALRALSARLANMAASSGRRTLPRHVTGFALWARSLRKGPAPSRTATHASLASMTTTRMHLLR